MISHPLFRSRSSIVDQGPVCRARGRTRRTSARHFPPVGHRPTVHGFTPCRLYAAALFCAPKASTVAAATRIVLMTSKMSVVSGMGSSCWVELPRPYESQRDGSSANSATIMPRERGAQASGNHQTRGSCAREGTSQSQLDMALRVPSGFKKLPRFGRGEWSAGFCAPFRVGSGGSWLRGGHHSS